MKVLLTVFILAFSQSFGDSSEPSQIEPYIVGGNITTIEDHPYQVLIECQTSRRTIRRCSGSIISMNAIVTAAHCVHGQNRKCFKVYAGHTSAKKGQTFRVANISPHPLFNPATYDNDIAVIAIKGFFEVGYTVQPIQIAPFNYQIRAGSVVTVAGWGKTTETAFRGSDVLREVDVKVIPWKKCRDLYLNRHRVDLDTKKDVIESRSIDRKSFCAGDIVDGAKDACQGDSGAGVTQNGFLVGIVSWGVGCGHAEYPGVYASVKNYRKWIIANEEKYDDMVPQFNFVTDFLGLDIGRRAFNESKLVKHKHKIPVLKKRKSFKRPKFLKKPESTESLENSSD